MRNAEEDLRAILEMQRDWCRKYGYEYLSASIMDGTRGWAFTSADEPDEIDVRIGYDDETPPAGTDGESR